MPAGTLRKFVFMTGCGVPAGWNHAFLGRAWAKGDAASICLDNALFEIRALKSGSLKLGSVTWVPILAVHALMKLLRT